MSSSKPPLVPHATRDLAVFASNLQYQDIPKPVIERMKLSILDGIGCCLYGSTLPWTRKVAQLAQLEQAKPVATLIGLGKRTSVALAALVNSTAGHAFELDDIHRESIVHANSIAPPVAFALAEQNKGMSGKALLTAMVAGYEVGHRVGSAATTSLFFRGFHPQGTSGTFVATATAARAMNLDAVRFQHALGIAGSQAGGLMAAQEGAMVKRFHSGRAAQSGVYSAFLAADGFTGITDVLEAAYGGYLSSYSDAPNANRLTEGLGTSWETLSVGYKPHASVTSIHTCLDGLSEIMREENLSASDIERVDVGLSSMTFVHCAWDYKAQGVTAAQMNLFYCMAVIALDGMAFTQQFQASRLEDQGILEFIKRIHASIDPEIEKIGPSGRHASRITLRSKNGQTYEKLMLHRRGSPENPLAPEDVIYKFRQVVGPCIPPDRMDLIQKSVGEFENLSNVQELMDLLAIPL